MKTTAEALREFNGIVRESDGLYREAAKRCGLPDCAFWVLYHLRDAEGTMTQSEVAAAIYAPKQTVNSAIRRLVEEGVLRFLPGADGRSKRLCLTERGEALAAGTVDRVLEAERAALGTLSGEEREQFLACLRRYTDRLQQEMERR